MFSCRDSRHQLYILRTVVLQYVSDFLTQHGQTSNWNAVVDAVKSVNCRGIAGLRLPASKVLHRSPPLGRHTLSGALPHWSSFTCRTSATHVHCSVWPLRRDPKIICRFSLGFKDCLLWGKSTVILCKCIQAALCRGPNAGHWGLLLITRPNLVPRTQILKVLCPYVLEIQWMSSCTLREDSSQTSSHVKWCAKNKCYITIMFWINLFLALDSHIPKHNPFCVVFQQIQQIYLRIVHLLPLGCIWR